MHIVSELFLPGQFDDTNAMRRGYEVFQRGDVDRLGVVIHHAVKVDSGDSLIVHKVPIENGKWSKVDEERLHGEIIVQETRASGKVKPPG
ncbi:hypothetical protein EDC04DRAFT_2652774 [Pisolithus marmoratus]|nr:hypothetical protein EDC04DRAFT_2652774 [Pisolithus marmoratus]